MSEMRRFTPEEANEALAVVRPAVERLAAEAQRVAAAAAELRTLEARAAGNGGGIDTRRLRDLRAAVGRGAARLEELADAVHALGVQVKDAATGLVDFPARHPETGADVLLCWRLGEPAVDHWHGLEEGFAGRKRLPF